VRIYSVSEYNQLIKSALEVEVGLIGVQGEVTDFRVQKDRLVYFELKDTEARCLCFMMVWDLHWKITDGMEIKAYGVPSIFQKTGGLHLRVTEIELVGAGALRQQFEMLKKKLEAEGLFAPERKRTLPKFPERIGLITSPGAAAYDDVLRVLKNRWGGLEIQFYPVSVQGFGAVEQICAAFEYFNAVTPPNLPLHKGREYSGVDVIILTRGGGSLEDLQAFNSEAVARAVFGAKIPVVCGVGHERDVSIADLVADVRAATPSNAAEIVVPSREEVIRQVDYFMSRVDKSITSWVEEKRQIAESAVGVFARFLQEQKERLDYMLRTLQNLNPLNILARGYSVVFKNGRAVRNYKEVGVGEMIDVRLYKGKLEGKVVGRYGS